MDRREPHRALFSSPPLFFFFLSPPSDVTACACLPFSPDVSSPTARKETPRSAARLFFSFPLLRARACGWQADGASFWLHLRRLQDRGRKETSLSPKLAQ